MDTGSLAGESTSVDSKFPNGRHTSGSMFLFCDGHVKWMTPLQVSPGSETHCANAYYNQSGCNPGGGSHNNAATTNNMTDGHGNTFAATFSRV